MGPSPGTGAAGARGSGGRGAGVAPGWPLVGQSLAERLARRALPIYALISVLITPSYGEAHLNTGLKKSNPLKHSFLDGKQIPATSPGDIHLSCTLDDTHGNDAPARSRISPKSGAGWVVCDRGLVPPAPWRHWGRAMCHHVPVVPRMRHPRGGTSALERELRTRQAPRNASLSAKHTLSSALPHQKVITLRAHYDYRMCNYCLEIMRYF